MNSDTGWNTDWIMSSRSTGNGGSCVQARLRAGLDRGPQQQEPRRWHRPVYRPGVGLVPQAPRKANSTSYSPAEHRAGEGAEPASERDRDLVPHRTEHYRGPVRHDRVEVLVVVGLAGGASPCAHARPGALAAALQRVAGEVGRVTRRGPPLRQRATPGSTRSSPSKKPVTSARERDLPGVAVSRL